MVRQTINKVKKSSIFLIISLFLYCSFISNSFAQAKVAFGTFLVTATITSKCETSASEPEFVDDSFQSIKIISDVTVVCNNDSKPVIKIISKNIKELFNNNYAFQFRNFLKTKLHKLWKTLRIYRKYQYPVNASELLETLNNANLMIVDEYYSNVDNFKNFKIEESLSVFRENCTAVYGLEKALNIEYQKSYTLEQRIGMHGPLWKVMGTRTIKVVPNHK